MLSKQAHQLLSHQSRRFQNKKLASSLLTFKQQLFHLNNKLAISNKQRQLLPLTQLQKCNFSQNQEKPEEIIIEANQEQEPTISGQERKEFKAETKKLLNIVARSIYTDKEVFLRELMSNASDALEKQRYAEITGSAKQHNINTAGLYININTNEKERILTIFDSGIGMTRQEVTDNLGTIAKSGSQEFVNSLTQNNKGAGDSQTLESIIGQFGVGFYSTFIVADSVEVISKNDNSPHGVRWVSDGSGEYEVSTADNVGFDRGTRITMKLKPESREYCRESEIEKVLKKYSLFITYPIKINGKLINNLQAIWYKDKREVTEDEYERFYEHLANTKVPYRYKLHYSTDVPLTIKGIFYIPSTHGEKQGMAQEQMNLNLYCRKVLIKERCGELLPNYLRFVRGVVDCEDLPLNISRETYQDSGLIMKLRSVVTRRVLKMIEDEMRKDPERYDKWYTDFSHFLKEGLMMDSENQEQLIKLMRYNSTFQKSTCSLEDYIKVMKPGQEKIYYVSGQNKDMKNTNPFMEPFNASNTPVLILQNQADEIIFNQMQTYKKFVFQTIETAFDEVEKDVGQQGRREHDPNVPSLPEDDITPFSLWLKNEMPHVCSKVTISKRLRRFPAVLFGQMTASMRGIMHMMESQGHGQPQGDQNRNNTLEINPQNPIIVKLNELRKKDPKKASMVAKQFVEQVMLVNGFEHNIEANIKRNISMMTEFLNEVNRKSQNVNEVKIESSGTN
eukprot:403346162